MPIPKYFFVYVLLMDGKLETHVVCGDDWTTLVRTKAFVESGVQVSRLLYLSNVKDGTHHERLVRGEVPPQSKSPYRVAEIARTQTVDPDFNVALDAAIDAHTAGARTAPCEDVFQVVGEAPDDHFVDSDAGAFDPNDDLNRDSELKDQVIRLRDSC